MAKPIRLAKRHAHLLVCVAQGWFPILMSADDRKLTARLAKLGLAKKDRPHAGCWTLKLTPLGMALASAITRAGGGNLKRLGVTLLAQHRKQLFETFDVQHAADAIEKYKVEVQLGRRFRG